jgi:hypothetical protein
VRTSWAVELLFHKLFVHARYGLTIVLYDVVVGIFVWDVREDGF